MAHIERLWAPWRSAYFSHVPPRHCIFCLAKRSRADRRHHVVARGEFVFALLNRYPYNNGHLLIAPYRHIGQLERLTESEWAELRRVSLALTTRLKRTLHPHAFNLGLNLGRAAGTGIVGHLHLHVVPRWDGDTNFLPVLAHTKVISQSLDELYQLCTAPPIRISS